MYGAPSVRYPLPVTHIKLCNVSAFKFFSQRVAGISSDPAVASGSSVFFCTVVSPTSLCYSFVP